ncbi:MAG: hypothetical protein IKU17_03790, partial [Clostridia bacterium]|nr:hypothetical protein [Clostridia bacterium]
VERIFSAFLALLLTLCSGVVLWAGRKLVKFSKKEKPAKPTPAPAPQPKPELKKTTSSNAFSQHDFQIPRYGYEQMLRMAQYVIENELSPVQTVTTAPIAGGKETEVIDAVHASGDDLFVCPATAPETGVLCVGGLSPTLKGLIKVCWFNQTGVLRIFSSAPETDYISNLAERILASIRPKPAEKPTEKPTAKIADETEEPLPAPSTEPPDVMWNAPTPPFSCQKVISLQFTGRPPHEFECDALFKYNGKWYRHSEAAWRGGVSHSDGAASNKLLPDMTDEKAAKLAKGDDWKLPSPNPAQRARRPYEIAGPDRTSQFSQESRNLVRLFDPKLPVELTWGQRQYFAVDKTENRPYYIIEQYDGTRVAQSWYDAKERVSWEELRLYAKKQGGDIAKKFGDISLSNWHEVMNMEFTERTDENSCLIFWKEESNNFEASITMENGLCRFRLAGDHGANDRNGFMTERILDQNQCKNRVLLGAYVKDLVSDSKVLDPLWVFLRGWLHKHGVAAVKVTGIPLLTCTSNEPANHVDGTHSRATLYPQPHSWDIWVVTEYWNQANSLANRTVYKRISLRKDELKNIPAQELADRIEKGTGCRFSAEELETALQKNDLR